MTMAEEPLDLSLPTLGVGTTAVLHIYAQLGSTAGVVMHSGMTVQPVVNAAWSV